MPKPVIQPVKPSQRRFLKTLVVGDVGVGKTRFVGSAQQDPRTSPLLILDFEGGTSSLVGIDVDILPIRTWEDYEAAYDYILDHPNTYRSVAIDSVTETHVFALLNILEEEADDRRTRGQATDVLQQSDYGRALVQMRRLLRAFRDLDCHIFFTALAQDVLEPGVGVVKKASLAGRLSDEIPGLMDVVCFLTLADPPTPRSLRDEKPQGSRCLILKNHPRYRAKVRTPWESSIPDILWDPTVTSLFDALGID